MRANAKIHKINDIEYTVMGGITTAQQYDFTRDVLYKFLVNYKEMLKADIDSIFLSFPNADEFTNFLATILVEKDQLWSIEMHSKTQNLLKNNMIGADLLKAVVDDFFLVNKGWAGLSPVLQGQKNRMEKLIATAAMNQIVQSSGLDELQDVLKKASSFMNTYSGQATETSS